MVNETTVEIEKPVTVADRVGENIYFDGETVAVSGRFQEEKYTADIDAFNAALTAVDAGVKRVDVNEYISIVDIEKIDSKCYLTVEYGSGVRSTTLGEMREALDQSRSL